MDYLTTFPATPAVSLDAKIQALLLARADATPFYKLPPPAARAAFVDLIGSITRLNEPIARVADRTIPGPAGSLAIRVYTPHGTGPFPILLYIHGGGWVIGDLDTHDDLCRSLCRRAGAVVVAVDYRLAPEHRFPAAVEDCAAALRWCASNAAEVGGAGTRLAVAGDSAGGNLSASLCLYQRDHGGPRPALQVLIYPVTNHGFDTASYHQMSEGYGLLRDAMVYYWNCYLRAPADGASPYASPLQAQDLRGLPPALIQTAHYDVLRDDGEAYAARLRQAGVPVRCTRYLAMNHGFIQFAGEFPHAAAGLDEIAAALREAWRG